MFTYPDPQEALSIVSEDQSLFEPPYAAATPLSKPDMTASGSQHYGTAPDIHPLPPQHEWLIPGRHVSIKREYEHINGGSRWVLMLTAGASKVTAALCTRRMLFG